MEGNRTINVSCCCGQSFTMQGFSEETILDALKDWNKEHAACRKLMQERSKWELKGAKERAGELAKIEAEMKRQQQEFAAQTGKAT